MQSSGVAWTEIDGIAGLCAAGGTLVLACVTGWMAKRTHDVATKTTELVAASTREAEATERLAREAQLDRQLSCRPQLELRHFESNNSGAFIVGVRNSGAGPALGVVAIARSMDAEKVDWWAILRFGDVMPGEDKNKVEPRMTGGPIVLPWEGFAEVRSDERPVVAVMCSDVLGRRFRFGHARSVNARPADDITRPLEVDVSPEKDGMGHMGWAADSLIWGYGPAF